MLKWLADNLASILGDWVYKPVLGKTIWLQVVLAGTVLLLTVITVEIFRFVLRRVERKIDRRALASGTVPAFSWRLTIEEVVPPLILCLWTWGIAGIISILLWQFRNERDWEVLFTTARWVRQVSFMVAFFWLLFRLIGVVDVELARWARRTDKKWDAVIAVVAVRALRLIVPLMGIILIVPTLDIPPRYHDMIKEATGVLLAGAVGFILYQIAATGEAAILAQYRVDAMDNLSSRKLQTQVKVLKRVVVSLIFLFTLASMLMAFESVRHLATSILASAGVAGVVIGFAAQKSLSTLIAGVQIAFTQPIRLDDVVIVEGEWGRIEEITMTYVVVRIWDLRRMVLPVTYFIEKPFQNWTRVTADLLGAVMLYTDYTVPVDSLREELDRILADSKLWDGKVKNVQVTDVKERTVEVRVLISARNSSDQWDLRCEVREKLLDFLRTNHPETLPRARLEWTGVPEHQTAGAYSD